MSKTTKLSDIDQAGNVLCTYTQSEKGGLKIVGRHTSPLRASLLRWPSLVAQTRSSLRWDGPTCQPLTLGAGEDTGPHREGRLLCLPAGGVPPQRHRRLLRLPDVRLPPGLLVVHRLTAVQSRRPRGPRSWQRLDVAYGGASAQDNQRHHLASSHDSVCPPHGPGHRARGQGVPLRGRSLQRHGALPRSPHPPSFPSSPKCAS